MADKPAQKFLSLQDLDPDGVQDIKPAETSVARRVGDAGLSLARGAVAVPEAAVGLADIATGGKVGKALENEGGSFGFRPKQAKEFLAGFDSPALKDAQWKFQNAEGVVDKTIAAVQNPSIVTNAITESVPLIGAGGVVGKLATKAAPFLGGFGAGAIGEGVVGAGSAAEAIRQETDDGLLTGKQAGLAAATGAGVSVLGAGGRKLAGKLGVGDVDEMIATGSLNAPGRAAGQAAPGLVSRVGRGAVSEGVFEELPQSLLEQGLQNVALDRPIGEELDSAAVLGTLSGAGMGGAAGALSRPAGTPAGGSPTVDPSAPPPGPVIEQPPTGPAPVPAAQITALATTALADLNAKLADPLLPKDPAMVAERDFLAANISDPKALARQYGVELAPEPPKASEAMGLDPAAGPVSKAAATAVDGGATAMVKAQEVAALAAEQAEKDAKTAGKKGARKVTEPVRKPEIPDPFAAAPAAAPAVVASGPLSNAAVKAPPVSPPATTGVVDGAQAPQAQQATPQGQQPAEPGAGAVAGQQEDAATLQAIKDYNDDMAGMASAGMVSSRFGMTIERAKAALASVADKPAAAPASPEWQTFAPESGSLNVPRAEMPQIKTIHRGAMVNFLKARGVTSEQAEVDPEILKPTQAEYSPAKVEKAIGFTGEDRSILVSSDDHIVDGHHQWLVKLADQLPVKVIRLNAPIADLLPLVREFPSSTVDEATADVQNAQEAEATGPEPTEAARVEAPATEGGDAAADAGVPDAGGTGDAQAAGVATPAAQDVAPTKAQLDKLQIPDMTDAQVLAGPALYGADNKRTAKLQAEAVKRGLVEAPTAAAPPAPPATTRVVAVSDPAPPPAKAEAKPKRGILAKAEEVRKARVDFFTPGNIVRSYGGIDEVLAYEATEGGGFNVTVHEVKKVGDQWQRVGKPQDARRHSTQPDARELAAGPVERLGYTPAAEVVYTSPRADGQPFPNAVDRGTAPAQPEQAVDKKAQWLKNVASQQRIVAVGGATITGHANGRVTFAGDPSTTKEGRALRDTVAEAMNAGATAQEVAEAALAKKPAAAPAAQPRRGSIGMKLSAGEVVLDQFGNTTTPFPKISLDTNRKAGNTLRAVDRWLIQNALRAAQIRGDQFNERQFQAVNNLNISQSDKDSAEEYLFGDQAPAVIPSILRPLVPDAAAVSEAEPARDTVVSVPPTVSEAMTGQMQKQKNRIARLKREAEASGMTLDEKKQAQTKVLAAETTLRNMRTSVFDAEDAAVKAVETKDAGAFAEHADLFPDADAALKVLTGQNDELDAEMQGYEDRAGAKKPVSVTKAGAGAVAIVIDPSAGRNPAPAKPDPLTEQEKAAKAKMLGAAAKLATLLSKNTRASITPEQEQAMLPIVIELFEGAMDLGYVKFKQAARYVREFIAQAIDQDAADSIPIDTLQGAYIATSRRHKDKDITPKGEVVAIESVAELEEPAEQADTAPEDTTNANPVPAEPVPAGSPTEAEPDAATGDRDSEPVGTGLAASGAAPGASEPVSGGAENAGSTGAGGTEPAGQQPSRAPRDRAGSGSDSGAAGSDFDIDADDIGQGGLTKKYRDNLAAIKIIKAIEAESRLATPDERKQVARYVGWGAIKGVFDPANKQWAKQHEELKALLTDAEWRAAKKSTLNAHYTSPVAVNAMYSALDRLGFKSGRVLESSVGIGNFFGLMPKGMRSASTLHGVELDSLTARLAAVLYPKAKITNKGFEEFDVPAEYFDLNIGNPPFGNEPVVDMERSPYSGFSIHNYFLAKAIDKLRPGGIMQVVVSHSFMDSQDERARKWIADRASLVGAARMPSTAFKGNAGTEVITDILIFQKHDQNGLPKDFAPWVQSVDQTNVNPKTGESVVHKVGQFFVANPQFVLGKPSAAGTMYAPNMYTVDATGDLKDQLAGWVQTLPENIYQQIDRTADFAKVDVVIPDGVKPGSYFVDPQGNVMQRGADVMGNKTAQPWESTNAKAPLRMKGMIALRDMLRAQMRLERSLDATTQEIEANREEMNRRYDAFLKEFGHLNSQVNRKLFLDDTEAQLLQALEFDYDKGISAATAESEGIEERKPSAVKADILQRRVAFPQQDYLTVTTAKDALLASLNYRGKLDMAYMQEVYAKKPDEIIAELGEVVFEDPQDGFVTADEYLSGDVKTKLLEAKAAAQGDARFKRNVAELEKVIPVDKKPSEISVSLGASFIPSEYYEQFVQHISGGTSTAAYIRATGQWLMAFTGRTDPALNSGKFGTADLSAQELFQLSMLGRGAVVKVIVKNSDGSTTTVVKEKETEAAREKQNAIKAEWQKWLWGDSARADATATLYNEKMNRTVERRFDGSHMTFPGMNPAIKLLEHQKNGVWRGLQSYQVLYDHVVGAGKTFEMATLAMEMRRLGIARKPLFVVPNHLTLQWRSEFTRLYPGSNILAATPEDFSANMRERLFSKITTGDWDAVVIGHSSLKKIGLPEETERGVLQEQIDELAEAIEMMKRGRGDRNIIRDMEGIRSRLEAKMKEKLAAIGKRSKVLTFDELGLDALFVDEMHEFKNLTYNSTMDRNPGMGNPAGSTKAFDMFVKVRWLFDTFGAKTPFITATGTPVSNSLVEMYNMQRYMQYPTLKAQGLHVFDAWAKQFGSVENVYEVAPSGSGFRQSTRFAKFTNLPALMNLYNTFADTVTLDDLKAQEEAQGKKFPVPRMVGGKPALVVAKRSPMVASLMGVPMANTLEDGSIAFEVDLAGDAPPTIRQDDKTGKWLAEATANGSKTMLGSFETEQEARLKIVERALTPNVTVDPNSILGRFANLKQLMRQSKGKINALSLTGEANKAGLDYRLIDPTAADFAGSKINLAVGNMVRLHKQWDADRGAQLVFCDMSIPLSARASYTSKPRRLYVRGESGDLAMKRGTMHTAPGHEYLPFFVVQRGEKDLKRFDVFDAVSGMAVRSDFRSKTDAIDAANGYVLNEDTRQKWIDKRESVGEIDQDLIDAYNNDNDVEVEGIEFFAPADIAGVSGNAAFSVYDDIKAKLIRKGIPENQIAFIHDYATPVAKAKLFKAVNSGEIRILLGSTPKMGAGTNVQERLVGLHHIDAPWRPSDLEQREGRIIRRNNALYARDPEGFEVYVGRYATEQTYDTRRWQILEHKARGIEQLRNFDGSINEIDDIDGEAANSADMKAAASGDPLILEETKRKAEVRRLEQLQASHADEIVSMTRRAQRAQEQADTYYPSVVKELSGLIATAAKNKVVKGVFTPVTISGKEYTDKEPAEKEVGRAATLMRNSNSLNDAVTTKYRGLEFVIMSTGGGNIKAESPTGNLGQWNFQEPFSSSGFIQRMVNYVDRLPAALEDATESGKKSAKDAQAMREQVKQPFAQAADLEKAREDYRTVQRALLSKGPEVPEFQKKAVADGIEAQKGKLRAMGFGEALTEFMGTPELEQEAPRGSTNLRQTGRPEANESDVLFSIADEVHLRVTNDVDAPGARTDTPAYGPAPQSQRDAAAVVRSSLNERRRAGGGRDVVWDAVTPPDGAGGHTARAVAAVSKRLFGVEVVFVKFDGEVLFNGAKSTRYPGKVFINIEAKRPLMAVLGHELLHELAKSQPGVYAQLSARLNNLIKDEGIYSAKLRLKYKGINLKLADTREELEADIVGDNFMDPAFWAAMSKDQPGLFRRIAEAVVRWLDDVAAKVSTMRPFGTDEYLSDINAARAAVSDAMRQFSSAQVGAVADPVDVQLSVNDGDDTQLSIAGDFAGKVNAVRDFALPAGYVVNDFLKRDGKLNLWHKTVGTQYNLAQRSPQFKRVFDAAQTFLNDVSHFATESANLAPSILPKLETLKDIAKSPISAVDNKAIAAPIFEGTLTWSRDPMTRNPVRMSVLEDRAAKMTTEDKAQALLRASFLPPGVLRMWQGLQLEQYEALVNSKYEREMLKPGIVFDPDELKSLFKLSDSQVKLYQEFRASVDRSLTQMVIADMVRFGGADTIMVKEEAMAASTAEEAATILRDFLLGVADAEPDRAAVLTDTANKMLDKAAKITDLIDRGYAPLTRFGNYSLDVVDESGERVYFGLFESRAEANRMARQMRANYPKAEINQGTMSQESYKLFAGVSPETLELFGEMLGLESQGDAAKDQAFQQYLKLAKAQRSAMKRLIQRKGIAGFSEDPGRVLAGFVYSNARQTSSALHMGEITKAASEVQQGDGELKDAALKLVDYVKNPQEEAQQFRSLLFAQYLGGSVASAMLNAMQPLQVTFPWLSQFGGAVKAAGQMKSAIADVLGKRKLDDKLAAALKKAEDDGIVSPQEIFQLQAQAAGRATLQTGDGTRVGDAAATANNAMSKVMLGWGNLFGAAEQFNRRTTFIAAYRTAVAQGMANPASFAERAVNETQFIYSKANKPRWARGAVGSILFTFKQYSVSYVELMHRMATTGGPEGKKAALLGLAVLFLMSGADGLPFAEDVQDLIDGVLQRLGYNTTTRQAKEQLFRDLLGDGGTRFMLGGISGLPGSPIDVSGRMGLGNLLPGTGMFKLKDNYARDLAEFTGPAGDLVRRAFEAGEKTIQGDVLGSRGAAMTISPTAIRNLGMAYEMATTGMYLDRRGKKVIDVDGTDAMFKAIGIQPQGVARVQQASFEVQGMSAFNRMSEARIADKWAKGVFMGDVDMVAEARDDLRSWNERNPDMPIVIKPAQIASRVKQMRMPKAERIAKTAPSEIRTLVREELRRAGE